MVEGDVTEKYLILKQDGQRASEAEQRKDNHVITGIIGVGREGVNWSKREEISPYQFQCTNFLPHSILNMYT